MEKQDAEPSVVAEPLTEQEEEIVLPDESQSTDIPPKLDKLGTKTDEKSPEERYEEGLLREFDQAYKKWLARRGWHYSRPPMAGEDPEYDSLVAHYNSLRYETQKRANIRRRCIEYIFAKRKEKHDTGPNLQEVPKDIPETRTSG